MAPKVGALTVHGMGSQQPDFVEGMIDKLKEKSGDKADSVCFQPVFWAPVLSGGRKWCGTSFWPSATWIGYGYGKISELPVLGVPIKLPTVN